VQRLEVHMTRDLSGTVIGTGQGETVAFSLDWQVVRCSRVRQRYFIAARPVPFIAGRSPAPLAGRNLPAACALRLFLPILANHGERS
jgi:hypothetical protein